MITATGRCTPSGRQEPGDGVPVMDQTSSACPRRRAGEYRRRQAEGERARSRSPPEQPRSRPTSRCSIGRMATTSRRPIRSHARHAASHPGDPGAHRLPVVDQAPHSVRSYQTVNVAADDARAGRRHARDPGYATALDNRRFVRSRPPSRSSSAEAGSRSLRGWGAIPPALGRPVGRRPRPRDARRRTGTTGPADRASRAAGRRDEFST